jgi:hypothetical protein
VFVIVRAKGTKVLLFQGICVKNISDKVSSFQNKAENIKFNVIVQKKNQNEEGSVAAREELKVQF